MTYKEGRALNWCNAFFQGLALEFWRAAVPAAETASEVTFLEEHLQLLAGAKVLDIACGDGRLATPLAEKGYSLTGIDLCQESLDYARQQSKLKIDWRLQDSREMVWQAEFNAAYCMGNSFAYFDRADSLRFFAAVEKSLKPGSYFVIETCLAAETFLVVGGQKEWACAGGIYMLMDSQYDCQSGRLDSTFVFVGNGVTEEKTSSHWIFTVSDICSMLEQCRLNVAGLYGSLEGQPYAIGAERLLLVAQKPG